MVVLDRPDTRALRDDALNPGGPPTGRGLRMSNTVFQNIEHGIYVVLGVVLSFTALMALVLAIDTLWDGVVRRAGGEAMLVIIDRLLFVLMLAEILHTVRVSITSGTLNCEPFLIVGLIASIRRVPRDHAGILPGQSRQSCGACGRLPSLDDRARRSGRLDPRDGDLDLPAAPW